ncbi:hypothetical protein HID58_096387 [Brassica napus]|uniref:Dof-type domain-containing protein n=1 Tax=Brassica napus TaxID=3708 RepID=A0ABQ7X0U3_BRANA|nr:hypothetical protein HID58_096387 [Brassica napus]
MQDPSAYYNSMMATHTTTTTTQPQQFPEQEQLKCPRCDSPNTKSVTTTTTTCHSPVTFAKAAVVTGPKAGLSATFPSAAVSRKNAKRPTSASSPPNTHKKKTKHPDPNPDTDPTRMLYGFPIGDQDVKGMEMGGGGGSFSSLLASNMQLGLGGIILDGSGWDPGMGLKRSEAGDEGGGNPWTDLSRNRVEKN